MGDREDKFILLLSTNTAWFKKMDLAGAFAFTQTACLLKLVIPMTNALPRWRLNVETKTKRALRSSHWLSFNELTNAKKSCAALFCSLLMLLHSCALGERSSGGIWKFRTSSFKCYVDHSHTVYSSGNIDVRNWVHLFEWCCISLIPVLELFRILVLVKN